MKKTKLEITAVCDALCLIFAIVILLHLIFQHTAPWVFIAMYWATLVVKYSLSVIADEINLDKRRNKSNDGKGTSSQSARDSE